MELTSEQKEIIEVPLENQTIKISAFAGTGKTTTLKFLANANPQKQFLYLCYNKSMQMMAERIFPPNVICRTTHSLAFSSVGRNYVKNKRLSQGLKPWHIGIEQKLDNYFLAYLAHGALTNFYNSNDLVISENHVPKHPNASDGMIRWAADIAQKYWIKQQDVSSVVPITHDTYLKIYQLSNAPIMYDVILLDEAQDTNPCVLSIIAKQEMIAKVLVGDPHQAIYEWRGAINAMDMLSATRQFYLTSSFRFGRDIAEVANKILGEFKGEENKIVGCGEIKNMSIHAKLFRTNAHLFSEAIEVQGKVNFIGGLKNYSFLPALDAYNLYASKLNEIKNPFVKAFINWDEYKRYSIEAYDYEVIFNVNLVERYGHDLPNLLERLKEKETMNYDGIVFGTAHKAKGLEWNHVQLAEDFPQLISDDGEIVNPGIQEINLVYVAVTRATHSCSPYISLNNFLRRAGNYG